MKKIAQRRSFLSKVREKSNISGKFLELRDSEFREIMKIIRSTDNEIRKIVEKNEINLDKAVSASRLRDYITTAYYLTKYNDAVSSIKEKFDTLKNIVNFKNYDILLSRPKKEHLEELFKYQPVAKKSELSIELVKNAGFFSSLSDMFAGFFSPHNLAIKALEKRFPSSFIGKLRQDTIDLVSQAKSLNKSLIDNLKDLGRYVATRKVDNYLKTSMDLSKECGGFNKSFTKYYNKNIIPLKEHQAKLEEEIKKQELEFKQKQEEAKKREEEYQKMIQRQQQEAAQKYKEQKLSQERQLEKELSVRQPKSEQSLVEQSKQVLENLETQEQLEDYSKQEEVSDQKANEEALKKLEERNKTAGIFDFLKKKVENQDKPQEIDPEDIEVIEEKPKTKLKTKTELPIGPVNQFLSDVEILKDIKNIRITSAAEDHLAQIFIKRLDDFNIEISDLPYEFKNKLIPAIKNSILKGLVIQISPVDDDSNPKDRYVDILTSLDLQSINLELPNQKATFRVVCRFSAYQKTLTVKTMQKNFRIGN